MPPSQQLGALKGLAASPDAPLFPPRALATVPDGPPPPAYAEAGCCCARLERMIAGIARFERADARIKTASIDRCREGGCRAWMLDTPPQSSPGTARPLHAAGLSPKGRSSSAFRFQAASW